MKGILHEENTLPLQYNKCWFHCVWTTMMGKWVGKPCGSFTDSKAERGNKALKACNLGTGNDTNKWVLLPDAGGSWL